MWSTSCKSISNVSFVFYFAYLGHLSYRTVWLMTVCSSMAVGDTCGSTQLQSEYDCSVTLLCRCEEKGKLLNFVHWRKEGAKSSFSTDYRVYSSRWNSFMLLAHPEDFVIFKGSEESNILKHKAWLYLNCYTGLISLLKLLCNVIFYRLTIIIQVILPFVTLINNATTNTLLHVS